MAAIESYQQQFLEGIGSEITQTVTEMARGELLQTLYSTTQEAAWQAWKDNGEFGGRTFGDLYMQVLDSQDPDELEVSQAGPLDRIMLPMDYFVRLTFVEPTGTYGVDLRKNTARLDQEAPIETRFLAFEPEVDETIDAALADLDATAKIKLSSRLRRRVERVFMRGMRPRPEQDEFEVVIDERLVSSRGILSGVASRFFAELGKPDPNKEMVSFRVPEGSTVEA